MEKQQLIQSSSFQFEKQQYGLKKMLENSYTFAKPINKKRFQKLETAVKQLETIYQSMICSNQSFTCLSTKYSIENIAQFSEEKCLAIENNKDEDKEIYSSFDLD